MNNNKILSSVAVTSRSFSKHKILRSKLLEVYPDAKFNDEGLSLNGKSLINFLQGCRKAITALEIIDEKLISQLPELEMISKYGVGLDMVDLQSLEKYGKKFSWEGGVNKRSVAELVISAAIGLMHRAYFANSEVMKGEWNQIRGRQLTNSTVGIVGCGNIGKDLVRLLQPFRCEILVYDIVNYKSFYEKYNVKAVCLDELLHRSDIVTLHLPLDKSTARIMNSRQLQKMKLGSFFINLARGGLVDEIELKKLLKSGYLSGAMLDVLEKEPPEDFSLSKLENVCITPHIGGSTEEAVLAMGIAAINGLETPASPLKFLKKRFVKND